MAALLLACPLTHADADSYLVMPVSMTLKADSPLGEFRLINQATHPIQVQVDVRLWSQDGHGNVESPSRDFIVSPRFTAIPVGGSQVVRVALRSPGSLTSEQSYRILFREVPSSSAASDKPPVVLLNYSVPLFVTSDEVSDPHLTWSAQRTDPHVLTVAVNNTGSRHAKIKFNSLDEDGKPLPLPDENTRPRYVLPGAGTQMDVPLPSSAKGDNLHLSVDVDGQRQDVALAVE